MQRIFVDSRDSVSGDNEEFTISIPTTIVIPFESFAVIDTVMIPTSSYTINEGNKTIFWVGRNSAGVDTYHAKSMLTGFYTPETLALEWQQVLNSNPQKAVTPFYIISFLERTGKFVIECPIVDAQESFAFFTTQWLNDTDLIPFYGNVNKDLLQHAGRPLGLTKGQPVEGRLDHPSVPCPQSANLQPYSQMFIRGDVGVPFASFGPRGAGNILRRVVITAPSNSMNYDAAATHYDNIVVAPGSYSNFSFKLTSWDGKKVDLNGVPWSFSCTIFPRD